MKNKNPDHGRRSAVVVSDTVNRIMKDLKANADADFKASEEKLGINISKAYGVPMPALRSIAKRTGIDQRVADELWKTGVHEARILASMVYDPDSITENKVDSLIREVDSWDLCDICCGELFSKTVYADKKIVMIKQPWNLKFIDEHASDNLFAVSDWKEAEAVLRKISESMDN